MLNICLRYDVHGNVDIYEWKQETYYSVTKQLPHYRLGQSTNLISYNIDCGRRTMVVTCFHLS